MHANLILSNHGAYHIQDFVDYLRAGFFAAGVELRYSFAFDHQAIANVILENFEERPFLDHVKAARTAHPGCPLIVVATEVLVDGVFNSARASGHEQDSSTYSDLAKWEHRTRCFFEAEPFVDLFLCSAEEIYDSFMADPRLAGKSQYMPLVWFETFCNYRPVPLLGDQPVEDIDFFFSGTSTSHRQQYRDILRERGHTVMVASAGLPEYLREHFMRRTKVYLGLKHYRKSVLLSKMRAYWALSHGYFAAFESGTNPTDLDEYLLPFATPDHLRELVRLPRQTRAAMAAQRLASFAAARRSNPFAVALERLGRTGAGPAVAPAVRTAG